MNHMKIMQHEIETAPSSHIQGEMICLKAMLLEHEEVEVDTLMSFKATLYPDTMYMNQATKEQENEEFKKAMQKIMRRSIQKWKIFSNKKR